MWEVAAWAIHLPMDSATVQAIHPNHKHDHLLELTRRIEYAVRLTAGANRRSAEPYEFPWEQVDVNTWRGDSFEWDDLAAALGGDPRLAELMAA